MKIARLNGIGANHHVHLHATDFQTYQPKV